MQLGSVQTRNCFTQLKIELGLFQLIMLGPGQDFEAPWKLGHVGVWVSGTQIWFQYPSPTTTIWVTKISNFLLFWKQTNSRNSQPNLKQLTGRVGLDSGCPYTIWVESKIPKPTDPPKLLGHPCTCFNVCARLMISESCIDVDAWGTRAWRSYSGARPNSTVHWSTFCYWSNMFTDSMPVTEP